MKARIEFLCLVLVLILFAFGNLLGSYLLDKALLLANMPHPTLIAYGLAIFNLVTMGLIITWKNPR
jgi:hypothetical protein